MLVDTLSEFGFVLDFRMIPTSKNIITSPIAMMIKIAFSEFMRIS